MLEIIYTELEIKAALYNYILLHELTFAKFPSSAIVPQGIEST